MSPSLFAFRPLRARAPLFSCSHSHSLALGYGGPFTFTHVVTFRVHASSRAHIVVSTSASTRPVHASTLARIRSRLVRTSVHHSVFALPRAHSRVTRPHFASAPSASTRLVRVSPRRYPSSRHTRHCHIRVRTSRALVFASLSVVSSRWLAVRVVRYTVIVRGMDFGCIFTPRRRRLSSG